MSMKGDGKMVKRMGLVSGDIPMDRHGLVNSCSIRWKAWVCSLNRMALNGFVGIKMM